MKTCVKCGERQPLKDFYKDCARPGGYKNRCKVCDQEYYQRRRALTKVELHILETSELLRNWKRVEI